MLKTFIKRPVLSTVISVIIIVLGVLGMAKLPVAQYPDISPPTVQASATYSGANADVVVKSVIVPLEQQINRAGGMTYMPSPPINTASAIMVVYFAVAPTPGTAAVAVQTRVAAAASLLPQSVTQNGVR